MKKIAIMIFILFISGCAKQYTAPPELAVTPEEEMKEEIVKVEEVEEPEDIAYAREEEIKEMELTPEEKAKAVFQDVQFDFDEYNIRPDARPILDSIAEFLNEEPDLNIVIEGHCDNRGTNEYNLALGERRAKAVKNYLVSLGVSPSRMITITYGEEKPLCTENTETCWQKNRRAHFVVVK